MNIHEIKTILREWFGILSIEEIIENQKLISIYKCIESILLKLSQ
jgi:hypothetical protein